MRITIKFPQLEGDKEVMVDKVVELRLKGDDDIEFLDKMEEMMKKSENKDEMAILGLKEFIKYRDEKIILRCNLTKEEYGVLYLEDKNKLRDKFLEMVAPARKGFF